MPITFGRRPASGRRGCGPRVLIAGVIAAVSLLAYFGNTAINPVTGKKQHISMSPQQEIALGLQAVPEMARQFGGPSPDARAQALVDEVGARLVAVIPHEAGDYQYEFHVLADPQTVNAFALPGGQVFITDALLSRLVTEGQLAGVLGHEIGHVVGRHSAERMAKAQLTQGLVTATGVAASDSQGRYSAAAIAGIVANFVTLKYGRDDELESDRIGVRFMVDAGYDPNAMIAVMDILAQASGGSKRAPDFSSTHPSPGRRIDTIKEAIRAEFPDGLPPNLKP